MRAAVFRAMLLGLLRDRAALAMSFLLPGLVFVVFAAIFSGATGEQLRLRLAVSDEVRSDVSERLLRALRADPGLVPVGGDGLGADQVRDLVRRGSADVGLIVRAGSEPLDSLGGFGPAPLVVVTDPVRGVAFPMLSGQIQRAYFAALPDVALKGVVDLLEDEFLELEPWQREQVTEGLADLRREALDAEEQQRDSGWGFQDLFERENVAGRSGALNHVSYYAGAIAVLFLLFSSVHGAISLLEERDSGLLDRILAGPGSTRPLVHGKFLFLAAQGFVQVGVIFIVAWAIYGVDLPQHLGMWSLTTAVASAAAASLALTLASACRTRRQAQTIANVAILVISALGGSMVPRFFMPPVLQDLGWITPNTWAVEAYTSIFWRDGSAGELWIPWSALLATAAGGLWLSERLARRMEVL